MKSLTESPALLTVHAGSPGQYIVRVVDLRNRSLVAGVIKLLADGESFVVVTPTDTKVFTSANGDGTNIHTNKVPIAEDLDPETQAAIAAEEQRSVPGTGKELPPDGMEEGDESEEVTPPSKTRRRP